MPVSSSKSPVRFGLFELDVEGRQLYRNGIRIRVARQPFELLAILLERQGEVVTREELRQRLWGPGTFVDYEHGLNKSVQKLREALGDSAESPRYIETIQRTGYRFIAPVSGESEVPGAKGEEAPVDAGVNSTSSADVAAVVSRGESWRRTSWMVAGAVAMFAMVGIAVWVRHVRENEAAVAVHSVAVLPLENISGEPNQEYFADGMTDELTTMLARDSTLRVTSRTSMMQYKGARRPLAEIAQALHVDAIVEGSVSRTPKQVHMTVQLIRADTDTHIWAQSYDRGADDAGALPDEAAREIASRLHSSSAQHAAVRYVNPAAHDAYLRGHYYWTVGRNEEAGKYYKQTVEIQPDYAAGWAGLSQYYDAGAIEGTLNPAEVLAEGKRAADKAVELDDTLPAAHSVRAAAIFFLDRDGEHALQEVSRATELDPEFAEAFHLHALILSALGRYEEAIAVQRKGTAIDPIAHPAAMAEILLWARQYKPALDEAQMRLRDFPQAGDLLWNLADIYHMNGMDRESAEMVSRFYLVGGQPNQEVLHAFASKGYRGVVQWRLAELERAARSRYVSSVRLAHYYGELGEREKTVALLNQAFEQGDPRLIFLRTDPAFDFIHDDPRYRSLVQRVGIWPAQ